MTQQLTIGPVLFNWPQDVWRDFYYKIADESCVDKVYIGEVICSKRAPFFEPLYSGVAERLSRAGKEVIFSTLSEVMIDRERKMVKGMCEIEDFMIEANDASALYHLRNKPHYIGPFLNTYNEDALEFLFKKGAKNIALPVELPSQAISLMATKAKNLGIAIEVMVYGRIPLALSARCYHARAYGRIKDNCQFVCEEDPDGMVLKTLDKKDFLVVNGVQTLSYNCLNLINEVEKLKEMGVSAFRLSPHTDDMISTAKVFRDVIDERITEEEANQILVEVGLGVPFSNGFFYGKSGNKMVS